MWLVHACPPSADFPAAPSRRQRIPDPSQLFRSWLANSRFKLVDQRLTQASPLRQVELGHVFDRPRHANRGPVVDLTTLVVNLNYGHERTSGEVVFFNLIQRPRRKVIYG